jgi:phosphate transport system permease protein
MNTQSFLALLLALSALGYMIGKRRALAVGKIAGGVRQLHSRPAYHGVLTALCCGVPAILLLFVWLAVDTNCITSLVVAEMPESIRRLPPDQLNLIVNEVKNLVMGNVFTTVVDPVMSAAAERYQRFQVISRSALGAFAVALAVAGIVIVRRRISLDMRARNQVERIVMGLLIACACIAILTTIGIVLSVLYESLLFFKQVPVMNFLFGFEWSPQMAIRADQVGSSGAFGAVPVFWGTLLISVIAMLVAVPIGLMAAIYLSEYAKRRFRDVVKPLLEILAGIPTVVYGFFAALVVAPAVRNLGTSLGLDVSSESALAAGLVMGIMIIPFVSSLSDDVINAVPQSLRDGAYALGATHSETIKHVVLPAALPGIVGSVLLALSRAIGETMIVVMAAGLAANFTINPLRAVTTVTVQIVTLLIGDQEFDSPKTLAAFALGLILFLVTLCLNVLALHVVRKYREQYE